MHDAEAMLSGPRRFRFKFPRSCPCRDGGMPRDFQTRAWFAWLTHKLYSIGLSSGGCWSNQPVPHECYVHIGGRPLYVFGISRDQWRCLLSRRPHWPKMLNDGGDFGMCGVCYPCPGCGSQTDDHTDACPDFGVVEPQPFDFTIKPFSDYVKRGAS